VIADRRGLVEKSIDVSVGEIREMCRGKRGSEDSFLRTRRARHANHRSECQRDGGGYDDDFFEMSARFYALSDQAPAMIISEILMVGDTTDDRQTRSFPIISIDAYISFRFPAIVIS
jgi:hypothetical protein